jgi:hypothetical protein
MTSSVHATKPRLDLLKQRRTLKKKKVSFSDENDHCACHYMYTRVARFSWAQHTKTGKMYQMTTKFTKSPSNLPIGRKIYQIAVKYTNIFHYNTLQNLPKSGIFGLKIYHLATLRTYNLWRNYSLA